MYLFFDTETTGLPNNWKAPVTDLNNWPRMVQLAYLLYDDSGNLHERGDFIVKPDGYKIPSESSIIHGISHERAVEEGTPINHVLSRFNEQMIRSNYLVAHNMAFDEKIVGAELLRSGMNNIVDQKSRICTMKATTNFCAIPGYYGYKWPKLSELHYKLFGTDFEEAHNAAVDIEATARCFWELKNIGVI
ncbi:3'-5' exonuclease [Aureitalea sp. L0-47]|uniref:3'-5' exonuclease n=1 Tax=Aureitalea sp. L0-47 TaxID=2816962 RepID=UPI002239026A|nr:3'-5' exonuclease [Aureitalea sp. L0-47]MCW5521122.1 3'-5' exonuclease [Aureitalea sp. L0-47]